MDFVENKFEISVAALVLLMVYGMGTLLKNSWGNPALDSADVVYEMPRPKSFQGTGLDLSDREIDRRFVNPFEKKKAEAAAAAKAAGVQAKATAKAADQAKKNAAAKAAAAKKPQVTARVIAKSNNGMTASEELTNNPTGYSYGGGSFGGPKQAANNNATNANEDDNKMSADQWRSLLSAQPTKANMEKLIAAFKKSEIDESGFYTIIDDLLKSNKPESQALGLSGAQAFPTARSFVIVNQNNEHFTAELKTQSDAFLASYGQASRVAVLAGVLQSNDIESVTKATQIIITSYQQTTSGGTNGGRPGRGEVNISSVSSYQKFIPLFQKLAQSSDSALAALANSALSALAQNPTV